MIKKSNFFLSLIINFKLYLYKNPIKMERILPELNSNSTSSVTCFIIFSKSQPGRSY